MIAQMDADYFKHGAGRILRRITSYLAFEGRPLTTRGRFINGAVFAWLRLLANIPGKPNVDRPIFITGLGRSGTTILGLLLSLNRHVGYLNEPKAMWHVIDARQDINGNYSNSGGLFRLSKNDVTFREKLRAHRLFSRYLITVRAERVIDKYPELIFRIDYVRALFPDAKFIFITRNGADAIPSVVQWSERLGVRTDDVIEDWWGRNDVKWHYLRDELILDDPTYREIWPEAKSDLDHTNRAAMEWILTMREGLRYQEKYPDAIHRISYESLLSNPEEELSRIHKFADLPEDESVLEYAKLRLYDNPGKTMPALRPGIDLLFKETMHLLGYKVG